MDSVPYAQRVKTCTGYDSIKEWRRERMCKTLSCDKSRQEWFEVKKERAKHVLSNWADFVKRAEPYNAKGYFESQWRKFVETLFGDGRIVSGKALLVLSGELNGITGQRVYEAKIRSED